MKIEFGPAQGNNINITKNTSVFNNDMMRLRLSNFPVYLSKDLNRKYRDLKKLTYDQYHTWKFEKEEARSLFEET